MTHKKKKCFSTLWPIVFGLIVILVGSASQADTMLLNYQMEESSWNGTSGEVEDSSAGTDYDGTAGGDATTVAGGISGRAGTFDRDGDYIDCGSSLVPTAITLEAWINLSSSSGTGSGTRRTIIARDHAYFFEVTGVDDEWGEFERLRMYLYHGAGPKSDLVLTSVDMADYIGEWTHVVGTYDGSDVRLYINGEEKTSKSATGDISPDTGTSYNTLIGQKANARYFGGEIDEVGIYDYALSSTQITANYNVLIPEPSSLVLLSFGLVGFVGYALKRRKRSA